MLILRGRSVREAGRAAECGAVVSRGGYDRTAFAIITAVVVGRGKRDGVVCFFVYTRVLVRFIYGKVFSLASRTCDTFLRQSGSCCCVACGGGGEGDCRRVACMTAVCRLCCCCCLQTGAFQPFWRGMRKEDFLFYLVCV